MALDSMRTLEEAVTETDIVETVNDSTIAAMADAARRLERTGSTLADRASDHTAAEMLYQTRAETSAAGAENALTEAGYNADLTNMNRSEVAADNHNTLGHSAAAGAQDAAAKADALESVSSIQIAVQEEIRRVEMGTNVIQDRTDAGVVEEMKVLGAVEEDTAKVAQNLEAELAQNAELGGPKV